MARPWPLRTRLIAGILALVALSLVAISVISYVGLQRYLVGRIDEELVSTARKPSILTLRDAPPSTAFVLPTNWLFASKTSNGMGPVFPDLPVKSQPTWPRSATEVAALPREPYTSRAPDGTDWRLLAFYNQEGQLIFLGQSLTDVEGSIHRFLLIQLIVGGGTLLIISAIGAEVIRRSLRPLTQIEAKAAAITAGDLTQRVPEYEPNAEIPKTEVGTLGRTLNTMLDADRAGVPGAGRVRGARPVGRGHRPRRGQRRSPVGAAGSTLRRAHAPVRGRRVARTADAAHHDPRLRRALPPGRGPGAGRGRAPDASHRGRGAADGAARRRPACCWPGSIRSGHWSRCPVDLRVVAADAVAAAQVVAPARPVSPRGGAGNGSAHRDR